MTRKYVVRIAFVAIFFLLVIIICQNSLRKPTTATGNGWKRPAKSITFGLSHFNSSSIGRWYNYRETEAAMKRDAVNFKCRDSRPVGQSGFDAYHVCFDEPIGPTFGNCLVYSFGIANRFEFDDEMAQKYKCDVFSFDPSMKDQPYRRRSGVQFYNWGIAPADGWYYPSGNEVFKNRNPDGKWAMKTLKTIIKQLNHENRKIDILKVDTEGAEVKSLRTALLDGSLQRHVGQLALEWHLFKPRRRFKEYNNNTNYDILETFEMLRVGGFRMFHALRRSLRQYRPVESYVNINFGL